MRSQQTDASLDGETETMNEDKIIESILDRLFTNGAKVKADRLLLIEEDYPGKARVVNARDLGGYSREAVRDILRAAIRQESTHE